MIQPPSSNPEPPIPETGAAARRAVRLERLRALASGDGALRLGDAARALDVSTMTLRRDLTEASSGLELLGGYVVVRNGSTASNYTLDAEQDVHIQAKSEAARRAAALVETGDTIFVDCGTTMPHLLAALPAHAEITIVCYALNVANAACRLARAQLFLLGGLFHPASVTFLSEEALRSLQHLNINKAFISAGGLHEVRGASCSNFTEVPVKRAVLERAIRSFLVIDSSKLGQVKPAHFASVQSFESVITEIA
ncbi:DeoR/GlpR transcriptional regulator [Lichenicola cladoniae]|uniref:DeoR/GlpR transcriptional regulator n=1 Tax=Lichenicola cladoniae TaxID=1484109 RepID=A0A6M8HUU3_9PROT|nr:DeoR/GlpR family DNA-binding transcription regulator [Lichenicola cladoniae]NPD66223.1 DeoR/GlpR transcriptional regulator [Acetobacteraceae bacterium]QKE92080.1 DeoR/GlpR transcriptional regulator [Lichenicola cladoniae]